MVNWKDRVSTTAPRMAVVAHDLCMVWLCWLGLHQFRYSMQPFVPSTPWLSAEILLVLAAQGAVFWQVGLYRGVWRFASLPDLLNILKASVIGLMAIMLVLFAYNRLDQVPRSVLLLYPLLLTAMLGMPRLLYRAWKDHGLARTDKAALRVLILGAGQAGETLVRDLRRAGAYVPVGFLDDAAKLRGSRLQGVPVLGKIGDVGKIAPETAAKLLVIAMPSVDAATMRRVVAACESTGLPFRTVPRLDDMLEGRSLPGELKEVAIEDLLGRKPVTPDWKAIRGWLGGRGVLVTGAGGSIGSELCRQLVRFEPASLLMLDRDESALHALQLSLSGRALLDSDDVILADIRDSEALHEVFSHHRPEVVFHAAALKHLPMLEQYRPEAWKTNVLGTANVLEVAQTYGCGVFVNISTDKAANPCSVLGYSKRIAEKLTAATAMQSTGKYVSVRFGNVLGSRGSVLPAFGQQIERGGPVTVTDARVTRYFMMIPEACELVIQAAAVGHDGEALVLDMGEPVSILKVARKMIEMSGRRDVDIVFTGLRRGEKLHEELFAPAEGQRPTSHGLISAVPVPALDISEVRGSDVDWTMASDRAHDKETVEVA